ncbi:hypothetical protein ABZ916_20055 [Streptomyces sp. NPDC046853]
MTLLVLLVLLFLPFLLFPLARTVFWERSRPHAPAATYILIRYQHH